MSKTLPQMVKIDRADPEQVQAHVEPYAWQKAAQAKLAPKNDAWEVPTVRLPQPAAVKAKR